MRKKAWKLVARIERSDGRPGSREYFHVREVDPYAGIATPLKGRRDLTNPRVEVKGGASPDFLDWIQPDKDALSFRVAFANQSTRTMVLGKRKLIRDE